MTHNIELGGQSRPLRFGMAALYEYERRTCRAAIADFSGVDAENMPLSLIVNLVVAGLVCGYKHEKRVVDFDEYDVADWMGEDSEAIVAMLEMFTQSLPKPKSGIPPATRQSKKAK